MSEDIKSMDEAVAAGWITAGQAIRLCAEYPDGYDVGSRSITLGSAPPQPTAVTGYFVIPRRPHKTLDPPEQTP